MAAPQLATVENLKVPPHSIEAEEAVLAQRGAGEPRRPVSEQADERHRPRGLVEPQRAHAVQQLAAGAFFDRFLRMDPTALGSLEQTTLAAAGLTLATRNLGQAAR